MDSLIKKFGGDPELSKYLGSSPKFRPYDGVWYTSEMTGSGLLASETVYLLLPYENGNWTEDRLTFSTKTQMEEFCKFINCRLVQM